ncbi:immunity protein BlpZ [Streptococcus marmotae]
MCKIIFFPDSVILDRLTPYIIKFASDEVASNILLLTTTMVAIFYFIPMLSFIIMVCGIHCILIPFILRLYVLERLLIKEKQNKDRIQ